MKLIWALLHLLVSGFPIIQDGKLVRAITHVLVNDPTRGYGIFAEKSHRKGGFLFCTK